MRNFPTSFHTNITFADTPRYLRGFDGDAPLLFVFARVGGAFVARLPLFYKAGPR